MSDPEVARFFLALLALLSVALACGQLFESLRLPRVAGEIVGGLLLGPTLLGRVLPAWHAWLFTGFPAQTTLLSAFYWLGLILLMFTAGFLVKSRLDRAEARLAAVLVAGGLVLPFLFGWLVAPLFPAAPGADPLAFILVMAIGTAITSIPVISRIFIDLRLMDSRLARVVLMAATVQDLILWAVLAVAAAAQQGRTTTALDFGREIAITAAFTLLALLLGPLALRWIGRTLLAARHETAALTGYVLLVCLATVGLASLLGVNIIFGALMGGLIIGRFRADGFQEVKQRIQGIAMWFFVPIYFALVGLKIDLPTQFDLVLVTGFLIGSSVVKVGSVYVMLRMAGETGVNALDYGIVMNTRGGPGIVLASVAHALGIITDPVAVMLIVASIVTAMMSSVWLRWRLSRGMIYAT